MKDPRGERANQSTAARTAPKTMRTGSVEVSDDDLVIVRSIYCESAARGDLARQPNILTALTLYRPSQVAPIACGQAQRRLPVEPSSWQRRHADRGFLRQEIVSMDTTAIRPLSLQPATGTRHATRSTAHNPRTRRAQRTSVATCPPTCSRISPPPAGRRCCPHACRAAGAEWV